MHVHIDAHIRALQIYTHITVQIYPNTVGRDTNTYTYDI